MDRSYYIIYSYNIMESSNLLIEGLKSVMIQFAVSNTHIEWCDEQNPYMKAFVTGVLFAYLEKK